MLQVTAVRAFADNYIWLLHAPNNARKVVAVDPGDAAPVEHTLQSQGLSLSAILLTHHHADHVGGVPALVDRHRIQVFGPANETLPVDVERVREGDHVRAADTGLEFQVLDIPGHTAGHVAYAGHGAVFCGDTLFSAGCGRLFEGTPAQMTASLSKLSALPAQTRVYCGHEYTVSNLKFAAAVEPHNAAITSYLQRCTSSRERGEPTLPSTIGLERTVNPFLRCHEESVKRAAEAHSGHTLHNDTEIFAVVRQWKDGFRA